MSWCVENQLKVAVGLVFNPDAQKILVSLRPVHHVQGGLWEFPGGKFEKNETPFEALKRELYEETGIVLLQAKPLITVEYLYSNRPIELNAFQVTHYSGEPYGREGQEIRWVDQKELSILAFPQGNRRIIDEILPLFSN